MENKLILHRGYKGKYPENSKISFIKALEENLPFEIDIRISKDNVPVIIHDDNLDILFNKRGKIKELDFEELKRAKYKEDSSQGIVTLEEFCQIIGKDYPEIFVHIKDIGDIHETIKIFQKYNIINNINFFACYEQTLKLIELVKKHYPQYKAGLNLIENSPYYNEKYFLMSDFIWADEVTLKWVDKEKIEFSHKLNRKIYCPSPDIVAGSAFKNSITERWKELILAGIDGIFTDLPDEFRIFYEKFSDGRECILCKKYRENENILYETKNFYVNVGYMIASEGHVMLISKKHYSCLAEIPDDLLREYKKACEKIIEILNKKYGKVFLIDYGPSSQSIKHQHTHFIPLKTKEYEIDDIIKEAVIPTGMQYEKGDLEDLKKVYEKEKDYIWFGVDNENYIYHIKGKYDSGKHLNWRYFFSKIKNIKSVPLKWQNATEEYFEIDKKKVENTINELLPLFKNINYRK